MHVSERISVSREGGQNLPARLETERSALCLCVCVFVFSCER